MEYLCTNALFSEAQKKIIPNRPEHEKLYTFRDMFKIFKDGKWHFAVHLNEIENVEIMDPRTEMMFEPSFALERFSRLNGGLLNSAEVYKEFTKRSKHVTDYV